MTLRRLRWLTAALVLALAAGALPARAAGGLPPVKHVFVIMLENKGYDETFGDLSGAPYLSRTLPAMGALMPNYYGVTHASLGNYIALVSGQGSNTITQLDCQTYLGVFPGLVGTDGQASGLGCVYPPAVRTIADQLAAAGLSWKGYMEDMGNNPAQAGTCRHPALGEQDPTQAARTGDQYAARHNPFVYFHSLLDSGACAQNDVPLDRLPADLVSAATTPNYSFITPNLCDDGHDAPCVSGQAGGLASADAFLKLWVPRIVASPAYRAGGLLAILFDEADGSDASACCEEPAFPNALNNGGLQGGGRGGGRTGAVLLSPFIDPGTVDESYLNHFAMLRSVEDLFGLGHLGYAGQAGLPALHSDAFTCFASAPRARRGRLPAGSEIKLAVIGQGTAPRPMVELKLWHAGRVSLKVSARTSGRLRRLGRTRSLAPCQPAKIKLPYRHGRVALTARAYGGAEGRTLFF